MAYLKILFTFCAVFIVGVASAIADTDIFEGSSKAIQQLKEKVVRHKLPNGLTVVMYPRGIAPVFSGVVAVGVGGVDEIRGETGISHMFEHMAFKGTNLIGAAKDPALEKKLLERVEAFAKKDPTFAALNEQEHAELESIFATLDTLADSEEFSREYERRGSSGLNAGTDKDKTTYFVELPKTAFEYWALAESEKLLRPIMRQFYKERDVVLEERRTRFEDSPSGKLFEKLLQLAYPHHPYGLPLIGFEEDIRSLTADRLEAFRKKYYVPENTVVSLVGDIDAAKDLPVIEKYFGRLPASPRVKAPDVHDVVKGTKEERLYLSEKAKPFFIAAYHKPNYPHPDDAALSVAAEVVNGSSLSPLIDQLVKKERIAVSISDDEAPGNRYPNLLVFSAAPKTGVSNEELLKRFDEVLTAGLAHPDARLIELAKRKIAKSYIVTMKSNLSLASLLAEVQLQYGKWEAVIDWYLEAMAVSADDIKRVSKEYIVPENRVVGFVN